MRGQRLMKFGMPLETFESPTPIPQGAEILLRVLATGICHSDLHICDGYYDLGDGDRLQVGERGLAPPIILGHEIVGQVIAVGPDADGALIGERRLVYPCVGCGSCSNCLKGQSNRCPQPAFIGIHRPGGYAEYVIVPKSGYLVAIGDLPPAEAAPYACSGVTTFSVWLTRIKRSQRLGKGELSVGPCCSREVS
jgi:propanol-preferring alcohol dehydrogenase